jgi:tripartite-type tricarboxylate transporter receptor subunit TctC
MTTLLRPLALLLTLACACASHAAFSADSYPDKPIRLIVPFPPGGTADAILRLVGQKLTEAFGRQVLIDNRPGGGTIIATEIGAHAIADGYTLLAVSTAYTVNPSLYKKLPYDPFKSLTPVTLVASAPNVLLVNASVPANTVAELIAYAKAKPRQVNFGSAGNGTSNHLAGEMFKIMANVDITHVPYKGDAPAITDLISGQIQMLFIGWGPIAQHVKTGKLKALAVTSAQPTPLIPDLPTIASSGLAGFESAVWSGIVVPAGTPANRITFLQAEISRVLNQADVKDKITGFGYQPVGSTSAEFGNFLHSEIARWSKVVREAGIRVE